MQKKKKKKTGENEENKRRTAHNWAKFTKKISGMYVCVCVCAETFEEKMGSFLFPLFCRIVFLLLQVFRNVCSRKTDNQRLTLQVMMLIKSFKCEKENKN